MPGNHSADHDSVESVGERGGGGPDSKAGGAYQQNVSNPQRCWLYRQIIQHK